MRAWSLTTALYFTFMLVYMIAVILGERRRTPYSDPRLERAHQICKNLATWAWIIIGTLIILKGLML